MAEVINLRQRRKRKQREDKAQQAAENRVKFGRTALQRQREEQEAAAARARLDGLRREPVPGSAADDAERD